jgi:uncharacterized membrane protein YccC
MLRTTPEGSEREALTRTATHLQAQFNRLMRTCERLQHGISDHPPDLPPEEPAGAEQAADEAAAYHDHAMLLFGAVSAGLAVFCVGLLWIFSGWEDGGGPVAVASIASCFSRPSTSRVRWRAFPALEPRAC